MCYIKPLCEEWAVGFKRIRAHEILSLLPSLLCEREEKGDRAKKDYYHFKSEKYEGSYIIEDEQRFVEFLCNKKI